MSIIGNFLEALSTVVGIVLNIYMWVVIADAILSWVNPDPYNPIVRTIRALTEPVYSRIRKIIPTTYGGIDFAPFIVVLIIIFLKIFLVKTLYDIANNF